MTRIAKFKNWFMNLTYEHKLKVNYREIFYSSCHPYKHSIQDIQDRNLVLILSATKFLALSILPDQSLKHYRMTPIHTVLGIWSLLQENI